MNDDAMTAAAPRKGLRILITNNTLASRAGSELYVRDLALALMKRGHFPIAYSTELGDVAQELRRATVPVIDDLSTLTVPPDVIHGQHHLETTTASLYFPQTPVMYICHGWLPWEELPPVLPSITRYVAVDDLCRERLLTSKGIAPEQVEVHLNFVDLDRFPRRDALPTKPESALVFSNYAQEDSRLDAIRSACRSFGITRIDVVGGSSGTAVVKPEELIGKYDIVFAKARCALEAMASGCAVIVTDYAGLGGMVTTENVARMRRLNFGARTMQTDRTTEASILRELSLYNAEDAAKVSDFIRQDADMAASVTRWIALYDSLLDAAPASPQSSRAQDREALLKAGATYLHWLSPVIKRNFEHLRGIESHAVLMERRAQAAEQALSECHAALEAMQSHLHQYEAECADGRMRLREQTDALNKIHGSRTWKRVTKFRAIRHRLRSIFK